MSDTPTQEGVPQNVDKSPIPEDGEQPQQHQSWNDDEVTEDPTVAEAAQILAAAPEVS